MTTALGLFVIERVRSLAAWLDVFGATALGLARLTRRRPPGFAPRFRAALQEAGVETLPVVALFAVASGGPCATRCLRALAPRAR